MKKIISVLSCLALVLCASHIAGAIDLSTLIEATQHIGPAVITAGFGVAGYWDPNGNWRTANGSRTPGGSVSGTNPLIGSGNCGPKGNYTFPPQITFVGANATAGALTYKFTQADNMTEALQGSLGTNWFAIAELPFGNGTIAKQDLTLINGAETLARALQTYGMKIEGMQLTGAAAGTQVLIVNSYRGNLSGVSNEKWTFNLDPNNNTGNVILRYDNAADLTSNVSFNISIPANTTYTIAMYVVGVIPYI